MNVNQTAHSISVSTHLCGDAQLGHDLTVGVHGGSKARPEAEVAVAAEQTVAGGHGAHGPQAPGGQRVLQTLVRVGLGHLGQQPGRQEPRVGRGGGGGGEGAGGGRGGGGLLGHCNRSH